jgi:hypothetical protein
MKRTNNPSATTRAIKKSLAGCVDVNVKSSEYCGGFGEVWAPVGVIAPLETARAKLIEAGFTVSEIKIYKFIEPCFFVEPPNRNRSAA